MATYVPAKRATEYIIYIGLESVATAGTFQSSATLASGDAKVSKDGGSLANLATLPAVTPGSSKLIKVTLSAAEMDADNVAVVFSDQSGNEWKDLILNIPTVARQIDDLATPTNITAAAGVTLADGAITAAKIASDAITAAKIADGAIDAATFAAGAINAAAIATDAIDADAIKADAVTEIQSGLATASSIAALNNLSAAQVNTEVDTALADYDAPTKAELDTAVSTLATAANLATVAGYIDTEIQTLITNVAAILADTGTDGVELSAATRLAIADAVLGRSVSNIDNTASTHSIYELIQAILEGNTSTGSWVIYKTNGSTVFNTRTLATDSNADPIVGVS